MTQTNAKKLYFLKIGVLGLAIATYHLIPGVQEFITSSTQYLHNRDFEGLRQLVRSYGPWGPVFTIILMAVQSIVPFVPGLVITITNAWIFGWFYGAVYSWSGSLIGAILDFTIARWFGRPVVELFVKAHHLDASDRFFLQHGIMAVFITRLTPVIPFKVISYGAGLTAISMLRFIMATGVGQTPAIVLYSILGQHLTRSLRATVAITSLLVVIGLVAYHFRDEIEKRLFFNKD
jgi:uncharacterized membrane protein YdjX (TVP38/TMEM64 family)